SSLTRGCWSPSSREPSSMIPGSLARTTSGVDSRTRATSMAWILIHAASMSTPVQALVRHGLRGMTLEAPFRRLGAAPWARVALAGAAVQFDRQIREPAADLFAPDR